MKYEIVELSEKTIVGFSSQTGNDDPNMGNVIGNLWNKLYQPDNVAKVTNRANEHAIGLYSDYEGDTYQVTAGFEVTTFGETKGFITKVIPAGKYAKFSVHGDHVKAVADTWQEIWSTPLDRTFTGDFEEYLSLEDIDIYVAIR